MKTKIFWWNSEGSITKPDYFVNLLSKPCNLGKHFREVATCQLKKNNLPCSQNVHLLSDYLINFEGNINVFSMYISLFPCQHSHVRKENIQFFTHKIFSREKKLMELGVRLAAETGEEEKIKRSRKFFTWFFAGPRGPREFLSRRKHGYGVGKGGGEVLMGGSGFFNCIII